MFHIEIFANSDQYLAFATHENNFFSMPYVLAIATGWVLGHLLGYVLLGIALYRARAIPRWASVLLILSAPVMGPVAYGTNIGLIQIAGYIMVLVASIPAAVAVMNRNSLLIELPS